MTEKVDLNRIQRPSLVKDNSHPILLEESALKLDLTSKIYACWEEFDIALKSNDKSYIRELHQKQKNNSKIEITPKTLISAFYKYHQYFIDGVNITPSKISPILIRVDKSTGKWADLFRLSRMFWSLPYSKGYGRRLRFIVYDQYHEAVIGIIGLQSPPADLACRDDWLSAPKEHKLKIVNCMMDAYTIGAIPPYDALLGGKLVASLVSSKDIGQAYWRTYAGQKTILENKSSISPLLAVTTTSAFGRSSIYNRLKHKDTLLAERLGYTKGYGTIHLETIYPEIEEFLKQQNLFLSGGFGKGPRVRWQNIANAFKLLGIPSKYSKHGVRREVFVFKHASNIQEVSQFNAIPQVIEFESSDLSEFWLERWCLPRSERDKTWLSKNGKSILENLLSNLTGQKSGIKTKWD